LTSFAKTSEWLKRWRAWLAGAVVLLLLILFFPFQSSIVPLWQVRVIDEAGSAVRGINVTEHWQHYLIESDGHEEMRQTDESGIVAFPARTVRAGLVTRWVDAVLNVVQQREKARFDPYASLVIWGSRDHETAVAVYTPATAPQDKVIIHRIR